MKFDLYDHNRMAYTSATEMMDSFGRAAVIHPTGTGKSFIGFQLAADHADEQILWFSPSRYIFETQLENLAEASGGEKPENIAFFTYAGLMLMSEEEIDGLRPAYIILDEFHCCGAQMWGQGVRRLLRQHPEAPVLGLSATNICYLDNQRDMAEELPTADVISGTGAALNEGRYGEAMRKMCRNSSDRKRYSSENPCFRIRSQLRFP